MVNDWYGSLGMDRRVEQRPGEDGLGTAVSDGIVGVWIGLDRLSTAVKASHVKQ